MRRTAIFLLLVLLVADGMAFLPGAHAASTIAFDTTAAWNTGTKASTSTATDTCENVTANAVQLNNTGNFQGIGLTTGTSNCATGAWGVSSAGLVGSWDMATLRSGKLQNFTGTSNDMSKTGSPITVAAKWGLGQESAAVNQYWSVPALSGLSGSTRFSFSLWVYFKSFPTGTSFVNLVNYAYGSAGSFRVYVEVGKVPVFVSFDGTNVRGGSSSPAMVLNTWYEVGGTYDGTTLQAIRNGTLIPSQTATLTLVNSGTWQIGAEGVGPSDLVLDDAVLFNRAVSVSEAAVLGTDGRSSFVSSGTWTSPTQSAQFPIDAQFSLTNQTANNRISRFQVLSSSGAVVFDKLLPYYGGSPFDVPINVTAYPPQWSVKLFMIGNGSATSHLTSLVLTVGFAPTFDANALVFLSFLILMFVLGLAGFALDVPALTVIGGISGFMFGWWLFLQTNNVPLAILMWGVGAMFMLTGAVNALTWESST